MGCREVVQSCKSREGQQGEELSWTWGSVVRDTEGQLGLQSHAEISWVRGQSEHFWKEACCIQKLGRHPGPSGNKCFIRGRGSVDTTLAGVGVEGEELRKVQIIKFIVR